MRGMKDAMAPTAFREPQRAVAHHWPDGTSNLAPNGRSFRGERRGEAPRTGSKITEEDIAQALRNYKGHSLSERVARSSVPDRGPDAWDYFPGGNEGAFAQMARRVILGLVLTLALVAIVRVASANVEETRVMDVGTHLGFRIGQR